MEKILAILIMLVALLASCDILLFHFGDDNEITQQATVIARVFDGTRPDVVYLTTDYKKGGEQ